MNKLMHLIPVILTGYLTACGGGGDSETSPIVEPTHLSGSIADRDVKLNEDTIYEGSLTTSDTLGWNWKITSNGLFGTATLTKEGDLRYTPNENYHGSDFIAVKVANGNTYDTAYINFDVKSINDLPVVNNKTFFAIPGKYIGGTISVTDADGDSLTYKISPKFNRPDYISFALDSFGIFTFKSEMKSTHSIAIPIIISDAEGDVETTLTFNIEAIKKKEYISEQSFSLNEDEPAKFAIKTTNTTAPRFTLSTAPSKGKATLDAKGILTYTPNRDVSGPDSLEITVTENGYSDKAKISLSISSVNDAPKVLGKRTFTSPTKMIKGRIKATDVDGDTLNFKLKDSFTLPKDLAFNLDSDGSFNITTKSKEESEVELPIIISDGTKSIEANFTFNFNSKLTDPLYSQQWHLKNTGQKAFSRSSGTAGHDINIGNLHKQGVKGLGVKVAVVDSGLEIKHEDLVDNILSGRSYNYVTSTNDPTFTRRRGDHGTSVAGIIAARGFNNIGGRGVAPEASLIGLNYIRTQDDKDWIDSHGGKRTKDALVINQSYGSRLKSVPRSFSLLSNQSEESWLKKVTRNNNNGRGVLFVKSAGNSFQRVSLADYSAYSKNKSLPRLTAHNASISLSNASFYNTVVSALNANASDPLSSYSSTGAAVFVSAPGGEYGRNAPAIITTDSSGCTIGYARNYWELTGFNKGENALNEDCNYTSSFNGTSSAAPVVSGVAALIFSVDDAITWRDVRYIIAKTAKKIDDEFKPISVTSGGKDFIAELGWITNNAGFNFHNWYGFGLIDASKAVKMAQTYIKDKGLLPQLKETAFILSDDVTELGIDEGAPTEKSVNITKHDDLIIEAVQVKLNIEHERNSDLSIELISPQGTRSMLLTPRSLLTEKAYFKDTVLLSNAFYGEASAGTWTIKVTDTNSDDFIYYYLGREKVLENNTEAGLLKGVSIRIYGH
ncbi:S8 family serine peptidase [Moritella sp. 28]|uniref:S8 family serine peptidase n=1 Tax=Moritella sp. 28 TaxID=2746232 RepID=UPI001BAA3710|nr:S8 family serine peptidase [Moritella sp. 28]QUM84416.1 S8 family serine peptidase [Moritella sp. 28]